MKKKKGISDISIKLIDFGNSIKLSKPDIKLTNKVGTPYYMAPEILKREYDFKCDVWASGILLYILLSGKAPFDGSTNEEIWASIKNDEAGYSEEVWEQVSNECHQFIRKMLTHDPKKRISSFETLKHDWIRNHIEGNTKAKKGATLNV